MKLQLVTITTLDVAGGGEYLSMSYLERDLFLCPGADLECFHFSPAGKALTDAVTSGGLSMFLNAVGQDQRVNNLIHRNLYCRSKGFWGLHRMGNGSPVQAGSHPQRDRKLITIHQLFPSSCNATWHQARPIPSTVLHQPFPCTKKGLVSQYVGTPVN